MKSLSNLVVYPEQLNSPLGYVYERQSGRWRVDRKKNFFQIYPSSAVHYLFFWLETVDEPYEITGSLPFYPFIPRLGFFLPLFRPRCRSSEGFSQPWSVGAATTSSILSRCVEHQLLSVVRLFKNPPSVFLYTAEPLGPFVPHIQLVNVFLFFFRWITNI